MRVLHLVDRLTERGGAYRHLIGIVERLAATETQQIACGEEDGTARVACPVAVVPGLASQTRASADLDGVSDAFDPDVVHLHTVLNPAVLEWAAARPAVLTVQDHRYFCPGRGKWTLAGEVCREAMSPELCRGCFEEAAYFEGVYALTEQRLDAVRRMPRVVVLSRYMRDELVAVGVSAERIDVIPPWAHGLDPDAVADGAPCVLFVGRLAEGKGVADAIAGWRLSRPWLPLVFAGTGPLRSDLEASGLEILGWLDRPALSRAYRRARAVILPSRWQEPYGIVGIEAVAMGVPVVAYDSGGVREWHSGPGLVPWGDVMALARALRAATEAVAPPARPTSLGADALTARLLEVYAKALAAAAHSVLGPSKDPR